MSEKTLVDEFCADPQRHIRFLQEQVASQAKRIRELETGIAVLRGILSIRDGDSLTIVTEGGGE